MQDQNPVVVIQRFIEAMNDGDLERCVGMFTSDAVVRIVPLPSEVGLFGGTDEVRGWLKMLLET
jgi:hypothetical protein